MQSVYTSGFEFIFILQQVQNLEGNVVLCKLFLSCLQRDPCPLREAGAGPMSTGVKGEKSPQWEGWWWLLLTTVLAASLVFQFN